MFQTISPICVYRIRRYLRHASLRKFDIVVRFFAEAPCSRFSGSLQKGAICTVTLTFRGSLFLGRFTLRLSV